MELKFSQRFIIKLNVQLEYIAQYRPGVARKFKNELMKAIGSIVKEPHRHRKSIFFESEDIRDLLFKNHIILYKIDRENNRIVVFSLVYNQNNP
ncbi:type II toxin-antitoxin system RelE/ParE family toxin [Arthrospiribacter ruber]|uniref:Type II toxin-antitoxin system RelE/ParE family toxin n=1 Tax=Arthrospiribacter ruber TaxID=2487934 RepID=A0A951IU75_9BACT|nr:type II toxin-antitoxin system RelE/ParE family toxin [Arthrospiribacter ruber]